MKVEDTLDPVLILDTVNSRLKVLARTTEGNIASAMRTLEDLAAHTDTVLTMASAIVGCVEDESVNSILMKAQSLGAAAERFSKERLQATSEILGTVTKEVELLREISRLTEAQKAIARETKTLSLLTNIEVARLGTVGAGFEYLAHDLAGFSELVSSDSQELSINVKQREIAINNAKLRLTSELPRMQREFSRIDLELSHALKMVDAGLGQLADAPGLFKACVLAVNEQIAGAVAAIQAQDITRQQLEHVETSLAYISSKLVDSNGIVDGTSVPELHAGLTIQSYQLRTVERTVVNWVSQIGTSLAGLLALGSSDLVAIGPLVLDQERMVSIQLSRIEVLERDCQGYDETVQFTLSGLTDLMELLQQHLEKSIAVRERLQLLTFNSIIEANRLGHKADAIRVISHSIKGIAEAWSQITDRSAQAMGEIRVLTSRARSVMEAFSDTTSTELHDAQEQTRQGLDELRIVVERATKTAKEMNSVTEKLQTKVKQVGSMDSLFDGCFTSVNLALADIALVTHHFEIGFPDPPQHYKCREIEELFSASYTTELERNVIRAALAGEPLPILEQTLAGNDVELF